MAGELREKKPSHPRGPKYIALDVNLNRRLVCWRFKAPKNLEVGALGRSFGSYTSLETASQQPETSGKASRRWSAVPSCKTPSPQR